MCVEVEKHWARTHTHQRARSEVRYPTSASPGHHLTAGRADQPACAKPTKWEINPSCEPPAPLDSHSFSHWLHNHGRTGGRNLKGSTFIRSGNSRTDHGNTRSPPPPRLPTPPLSDSGVSSSQPRSADGREQTCRCDGKPNSARKTGRLFASSLRINRRKASTFSLVEARRGRRGRSDACLSDIDVVTCWW